ncbi:DUF1801 domain-containing protein [Ochrovirga pacifica]|uniref:DUF1801 domain-containing protein n=1 Tax=Ochrovirga pacifica TaxID=1042376 RepID=UPI00025597E0|nr:DUF1801 domain-containing protein [Ochrovirga pacifica]
MNELTLFFEKLEEPNKSVFLFLKDYILNYHPEIDLFYKWKLPYLYYQKKPLCYLWKDKKTKEPYLGFAKGFLMEHPALVTGNRNTIKILPIPVDKDVDVQLLSEVLELALDVYR